MFREPGVEEWREFGQRCIDRPRQTRRAVGMAIITAFAGGVVVGAAVLLTVLAVITW
jgi:hypothetical protein